jgi:transposase-like protein
MGRVVTSVFMNTVRSRALCSVPVLLQSLGPPSLAHRIDEVFLTIHGERHYLWRAVDQDGHVLAILVQRRRNKQAAKPFFRKLRKGCQYVPGGS